MYKVHQVLQPAGVVLDVLFLNTSKEYIWLIQADNIAKNGSFAKIKLSSTVFLTVKELWEDGLLEGGNFCQSLF